MDRDERLMVDLACALPPQYLDLPPDYQSIEQASRTDLQNNPGAGEKDILAAGGARERGKSLASPDTMLPDQTRGKSTSEMSRSTDISIDNLLAHPLLQLR